MSKPLTVLPSARASPKFFVSYSSFVCGTSASRINRKFALAILSRPVDARPERVHSIAMRPTTEAPANSPPACVDDDVEPAAPAVAPVFPILFALSFAHLVNDTLQSLIPAIYPILKSALQLDYSHIGLITLTNQLTASLLQPFVGAFTDKHPQPFSLALGMASTLVGLVLLALAPNLAFVLIAVAFVGIGSSVFHPEASRGAHRSE